MLTITSAARTHQGRVRTLNEDSMLVTDTFAAVADGLGGHAAGEVASRIAVDRLGRLAEHPAVHPDDVVSAIADANKLIIDAVRAHPENEGMGTTVTGFGLVELGGAAHCVVFNVGDSRVYRLLEGVLEQVTVDHSEVEELVAAGVITAQDAARHPRRNVVTRCLGSLPSPVPDLWVYPPAASERYLICSDGLTNEVDDDAIAATLRDRQEPGEAAEALVAQALDAGGRDNIAVIVVDLVSVDHRPVDVDTAPRVRADLA
ncbi:protein phosphatase [Jatrophihabitans endophyticus]|uniref:Protein phosphatase n=1 Tax=Jatrophihabitans endophyticus TaxID=1206085 RepID=A0A1M5PC23_9ACTN|nr:protein phosphatase 2C domain-containing protein [Jatrophihabitans endophyticus]SHG99306.1 protein phosphatase [Jatrophihabitans endophyticus]